MPDEETFAWDLSTAKVAWYGVVIAIVIFLIITNIRLTKTQNETQKEIANLDEKVNGIRIITFDLITAVISSQNKSVDYQQEFESKVWNSIDTLRQLDFDWWVKKHNLNLTYYQNQMGEIAANCSLREMSENFIQHWTDDAISLQVNSSKGEITVNYFSDGTIKCKKDFWDNKNISCQELCSKENGADIKA